MLLRLSFLIRQRIIPAINFSEDPSAWSGLDSVNFFYATISRKELGGSGVFALFRADSLILLKLQLKLQSSTSWSLKLQALETWWRFWN